jgi:hypothetical protein
MQNNNANKESLIAKFTIKLFRSLSLAFGHAADIKNATTFLFVSEAT